MVWDHGVAGSNPVFPIFALVDTYQRVHYNVVNKKNIYGIVLKWLRGCSAKALGHFGDVRVQAPPIPFLYRGKLDDKNN